MKKNKTLYIVLGGIVVAAAAFFGIKALQKPKSAPSLPATPPSGGGGTTGGGSTTGGGGFVDEVSDGFSDYIVTTQTTDLNIRQSPSTSSAVVGSLAKGSIVRAKPYNSGWSILESGNYVSSQYLTKR